MSHSDVPATVGLVKEVRSELLAESRALRHEMGAMDNRLSGKIGLVEAKVDLVEAKVDQVLSKVHGIQVIVEEQRGENRIVLDGIKSVMQRQDRAEEEAKEFRTTLTVLLRARESRT